MSNLIESMINENVQFSESKKVKKTTDKKKVVKESVNKKTYHISNIEWDIEEEDLDLDRDDFGPGSDYYETFEQEKQKIEGSLPSEFDVEIDVDYDDTDDDIEEKLTDIISDKYGWLVNTYRYEEVAKESCKSKKRKKVKEAVDGKDEVCIIIKGGMVQEVFSTRDDIDASVIDLDVEYDSDLYDDVIHRFNRIY